jgi:hypothetical protein
MVLLTIGDSWTQGDSPSQQINWEAKQNLDWYHIPPSFSLRYAPPVSDKILNKFYDSEVWPKTLGRNLGMQTYNAGRLGISNKTMVKQTINSIKYLTDEIGYNHKDIFVVIGLSSKYRSSKIEYFKDKKKYQVSDFKANTLFKEDFLNLSENYFKDEFCLQIYILQNWLNNLKIKHLFFNAFEDQNDVKNSSFYDINLDNWFNNSLDAHFRICVENNFKEKWSSNGDYFVSGHPTDISHEYWGNHLTEYIENNKIL